MLVCVVVVVVDVDVAVHLPSPQICRGQQNR